MRIKELNLILTPRRDKRCAGPYSREFRGYLRLTSLRKMIEVIEKSSPRLTRSCMLKMEGKMGFAT